MGGKEDAGQGDAVGAWNGGRQGAGQEGSVGA